MIWLGNTNVEDTDYLPTNYYADTKGPTLTVKSETNNNITNQNIINYIFDISDPKLDDENLGSGVKASQFGIDDITVTNGTIIGSTYNNGNLNAIRVLAYADGVQRVYVKPRAFDDNVGNSAPSEEKTVAVTINTQIPEITIDNNGGNYVLPTSGNGKIGTKVIVSKQVEKLEYAWTNSINTPSAYTTISNPNNVQEIIKKDITNTGTWYLQLKATDSAGNIGKTISSPFNITNANIVLTSSNNAITKENVNVTVNYGDKLTENRYAGFGDARNANLENVTAIENGVVYAEATDKMGNKVTANLNISNIDKIQPILEVIKSTEEITKNNVILTISAKDNESGIKNIKINNETLTLIDGKAQKTITQNGKYTIIVTDNVGNEISKEETITNIDKTAPTIDITPNGGKYELQNETDTKLITISTAVKDENAVKTYYAWKTSNTKPLDNEYIEFNTITITKQINKDNKGKLYLYIKAVDDAGNVSTFGSNEYDIIIKDSTSGITFNTKEKYIASVIKRDNINYVIVEEGTNVNQLLANINNKYNYTIAVKDENRNNTISNDETLKTKETIVIDEIGNKEQYVIVVKGDANCDGKVDINDIFKINKYRLGKKSLNEIEQVASDVNEDRKIDIGDIFKINKYRLGKNINL